MHVWRACGVCVYVRACVVCVCCVRACGVCVCVCVCVSMIEFSLGEQCNEAGKLYDEVYLIPPCLSNT